MADQTRRTFIGSCCAGVGFSVLSALPISLSHKASGGESFNTLIDRLKASATKQTSKFTAWAKHPAEMVLMHPGNDAMRPIPDPVELGIPLQYANYLFPRQQRNHLRSGLTDETRLRLEMQRYSGFLNASSTFYFGDEENGNRTYPTARHYAEAYDRWVALLKEYYPNAKVSPCGCGISPNNPWWQEFFAHRKAPVDECRFHAFWFNVGEIVKWQDSINEWVEWCGQKNLPLVIGSFGPNAPSEADGIPTRPGLPLKPRLRDLRAAMEFIKSTDRIVSASYWHLQQWDQAYPLSRWNPSVGRQTLTPDGDVFKECL